MTALLYLGKSSGGGRHVWALGSCSLLVQIRAGDWLRAREKGIAYRKILDYQSYEEYTKAEYMMIIFQSLKDKLEKSNIFAMSEVTKQEDKFIGKGSS